MNAERIGYVSILARSPATCLSAISLSKEKTGIMEYRLLGASGLEVSVLSMGTMTMGGEVDLPPWATCRWRKRGGRSRSASKPASTYSTPPIFIRSASRKKYWEGAGRAAQRYCAGTKGYNRLGPGTNRAGTSRKHLIEAAKTVCAAWGPITSICIRCTRSIR